VLHALFGTQEIPAKRLEIIGKISDIILARRLLFFVEGG
jgi:hypothetical protein